MAEAVLAAVVGYPGFRRQRLANAAVEALHHAVGLQAANAGQFVPDTAPRIQHIKRVRTAGVVIANLCSVVFMACIPFLSGMQRRGGRPPHSIYQPCEIIHESGNDGVGGNSVAAVIKFRDAF